MLITATLTGVAHGQDRVCYEYDEYGRIKSADYDDGSRLDYQIDHGDNRESLTQSTGQTYACASSPGQQYQGGGEDNPPPPPPNTAPVALDDSVTIQAFGSVTIYVLANDSDADSDPLVITSHTSPSSGAAVQVNSNTAISYTAGPAGNFVVFTYTISDGQGGTDTATIEVEVVGGGGGPGGEN